MPEHPPPGSPPPVVESALQVRVRETLAALGGYWKPSGAAIRLLEELGELAEHALDPLLPAAALAGECADLWIITTALADQFYGFVDEPHALPGPPPEPAAHLLIELVAAGGRIGRVVNYYDGPKNPRSFDGWLTLEHAVAAFHGRLAAFAAASGVELRPAIDAKLEENRAVDAGRFAASYDPRTAPVLARFAPVLLADGYPYPEETRLFGAPDWIDDEPGAWISAVMSPLQIFLRARGHERLDGFVLALPPQDLEASVRAIGLAVSALGSASTDEPSTPRWHELVAPAQRLEFEHLGPAGSTGDPGDDETFVLVRVPTDRDAYTGLVH